MSKMDIKKFGDSILRVKCQEIKNIDDQVKKTAMEMLETMYQGRGVGLAAPQVGLNWQLVVIDAGKGPLVLINPKIIQKSNILVKGEEGCLSLPNVSLKIKRPSWVEIENRNIKTDNIQKFKAEGLLARVIQHEMDHLEGKLIIDRVPFWEKWCALGKLKTNRK